MLNKINLKEKVKKEAAKEEITQLENRISYLQRKYKDMKVPIIILIEGWSGSGKGTLINKLIQGLDPRGFQVFTTQKATEEERRHPYLWRFWCNIPEKGKIHIFDRGWYQCILKEPYKEISAHKAQYEELLQFERNLMVDGTIIFKFFLHISKEEQKERFKHLESDEASKWRITKQDWQQNKEYEKYYNIIDHMLANTSTQDAPWNIINAENKYIGHLQILKTVVEALEANITGKQVRNQESLNSISNLISQTTKHTTHILQNMDLSLYLTENDYNRRCKELQKKLEYLQYELYKKRVPVILAFEGWDAAGKGGAIKRLTQCMDPRGYQVIPIAAPNEFERNHHYLWRFWKAFPRSGHIAIFDRTWYGRVLVERIERFCSMADWQRAYSEINQMEQYLVASDYLILKFWLHIDKDEQAKRFQARQETPEKQWKITAEDWRNREKWDDYELAVNDMLSKTSTEIAPWIVVEANSKYYARIKILETVINALETRLNH